MNSKIITSFLILLMILVVPQAHAQSEPLSEVNQKSIQVTIDNEGKVEVIHQIRDSNEDKILKFVNGTVLNLEFIDRFGRHESVDVIDGLKNIPILANQGELFVKYDLDDALIFKNNIWTLDFRYLETTTFVVPEEVELFFANERPVFLEEKNAFTCHGCQMVLEYSIDEPKKIQHVNWENQEFLVEMITYTEIDNFEFNQSAKQISFKVNESNQFVTTIIPLELLWGPYVVLLDDEKIFFHEYINNGTHVWVNMKPETTGQVAIIGTTVIPEFPIIAPLAIGFLMIMIMPFVRKFNLH
jgi:hypothetical protein